LGAGGFGFRVQGSRSWFRVDGLGIRVWGCDSVFRVQDLRLGRGFGREFGVEVCGVKIRDEGCMFGVEGIGFRF